MSIGLVRAGQFKKLKKVDVSKLGKMTYIYEGRHVSNKVGRKNPRDLGGGSFNKSKGYKAIHGCCACQWMSTDKCPHLGSVCDDKFHSEGICYDKIRFVEGMRDLVCDGKPNSKLREVQFKEMLDVNEIALFKRRKMICEIDVDLKQWRSDDALKWSKLSLESKFNKVKQEEGSKLQVDNNKTISIGEYQRMINNKDVVDAEYEVIEDDN